MSQCVRHMGDCTPDAACSTDWQEVNARLSVALLQIEELKKDKEKITEGAIRFVQSSLCREHQGLVKMQSPGEFIAEHDGKCVLCAFRLVESMKNVVDAAVEWWADPHDTTKTLVDLQNAVEAYWETHKDKHVTEKRIGSPQICMVQTGCMGGVCGKPLPCNDHVKINEICWCPAKAGGHTAVCPLHG